MRTSLGISEPTTFEELRSLLSKRCKSTKSVSQIQATLRNFLQKSMNVNTYHEELIEMITKLNELQIKSVEGCNST